MVVTMPNGPALWQAVLAVMPPGSIIAGGAVRDYLLGIEPKDIDVFTLSSDWRLVPGFRSLESDAAKAAEYQAMPTVSVVARGHLHGHRVDHVGVHMPDVDVFTGAALATTFDFGITRCWFDGTDFGDTEAAQRDRAERTVTLLIGDRCERAFDRFARFNGRMGGLYRLVPGSDDVAAQMVGAAL